VLPRRRVAALITPAVLLTALSACGDDPEPEGLERLSSVTVEGEPGTAPEVTWKDEMTADGIEAETLVEGDGDEVEDGDTVVVNFWVGNGFTQRETFSTYEEEAEPETVTVTDELSPVFKEGILGQTIGSRVAVTSSAEEAFGEAGNPELGIGNKDPVLLIVDVMEMYTPPEPVDVPKSKMPSLVLKKGEPVGFDFDGLPEPKAEGELMRTILEEGKGEDITTDMTLEVDYLGAVYGGKEPFDESYSGEPASFELTGVVEGWALGLTGVKSGSRVLLAIPPDLGYGAQAQEAIPANSTLYFVIDILAAE